MSRHTDSAAGHGFALCSHTLRCDGCGAVVAVADSRSAGHAEDAACVVARHAGWRLAQTTESDLCAACVEREVRP